MSKNIVVFSDGTAQEGGKGNNTNVYKLFNMIEDRTLNQIAFYDRGLGTGWRKVTGSAFGAGISKNIQECYAFIFENYQAGDQIYLFGFSRGAFTVRSLGGFISLFGILPKSRRELINAAYKIYKIKNPEKRKTKAEIFLAKHHTMKCQIKFIGVWDTVGALGLPFKTLDVIINKVPWFKHEFHNTTLSENVEFGYHALSIDDERLTFHPTLWDERNVFPGQAIKQVWFAGMHTDVGGGYEEQELSDIALKWMIKEAKDKGLLIYRKVKMDPNPDGFMHNSRSGFGKFYRKKQRSLKGDITRPRVHQSVLDRVPDQNNNPDKKYNPWILKHNYDVEP